MEDAAFAFAGEESGNPPDSAADDGTEYEPRHPQYNTTLGPFDDVDGSVSSLKVAAGAIAALKAAKAISTAATARITATSKMTSNHKQSAKDGQGGGDLVFASALPFLEAAIQDEAKFLDRPENLRHSRLLAAKKAFDTAADQRTHTTVDLQRFKWAFTKVNTLHNTHARVTKQIVLQGEEAEWHNIGTPQAFPLEISDDSLATSSAESNEATTTVSGSLIIASTVQRIGSQATGAAHATVAPQDLHTYNNIAELELGATTDRIVKSHQKDWKKFLIDAKATYESEKNVGLVSLAVATRFEALWLINRDRHNSRCLFTAKKVDPDEPHPYSRSKRPVQRYGRHGVADDNVVLSGITHREVVESLTAGLTGWAPQEGYGGHDDILMEEANFRAWPELDYPTATGPDTMLSQDDTAPPPMQRPDALPPLVYPRSPDRQLPPLGQMMPAENLPLSLASSEALSAQAAGRSHGNPIVIDDDDEETSPAPAPTSTAAPVRAAKAPGPMREAITDALYSRMYNMW